MADSARAVMIAALNSFTRLDQTMPHDMVDKQLTALCEAGFTPPLSTGAINKALQDAFQFGVEKGIDTAKGSAGRDK